MDDMTTPASPAASSPLPINYKFPKDWKELLAALDLAPGPVSLVREVLLTRLEGKPSVFAARQAVATAAMSEPNQMTVDERMQALNQLLAMANFPPPEPPAPPGPRGWVAVVPWHEYWAVLTEPTTDLNRAVVALNNTGWDTMEDHVRVALIRPTEQTPSSTPLLLVDEWYSMGFDRSKKRWVVGEALLLPDGGIRTTTLE